jgi:hypothetical protein
VTRRLCRYANKVFDLGTRFARIKDSRIAPRITTFEVLRITFALMLARLGSLNAAEQEDRLTRGAFGHSADTIGRVVCLIEPEQLREVLAGISHQLKRNKCFPSSPRMPLIFVAVDGHEFFSSRSRHCAACCERKIKVKDREVTEYYHRAVVCHLIGYPIALPLDLEPIAPGEGELPAAHRLMKRVFSRYARFFDGVSGDALYMNGPFFSLCEEYGKYALAVLKNEDRHLYRDASGLFATMSPGEFENGSTRIRHWDVEGFTSCEGLRVPLRVLHAEETTNRRRRVAGQWVQTQEITNWRWATTVPMGLLSARQLWTAGHHRWDIENDLFNTLGAHWYLNHCFKHDPVAIVNFVLMLFIAFALVQCFYLRNIKPERRRTLSLIAVSRRLYLSLHEVFSLRGAVPAAPP